MVRRSVVGINVRRHRLTTTVLFTGCRVFNVFFITFYAYCIAAAYSWPDGTVSAAALREEQRKIERSVAVGAWLCSRAAVSTGYDNDIVRASRDPFNNNYYYYY